MSKQPKHYLPPATLTANHPGETALLLSPEQAASLLGLSTKWLAAAREGRKGIEGPPYIKLGRGKTSPIRYKFESLLEWLSTFEEVVNSAGAKPALHRSFSEFQRDGGSLDVWPIAIDRKTLEYGDFFAFARQGMVRARTKLQWVSHEDLEAGRLFRLRLNLTALELQSLRAAGAGKPLAGIQALLKR